MGTDVLDKITDGLDIRTKVHKEWLTNNLLFFCTSVEISFECGRTGRASLLFNRKILLFLLFFCLKKIYHLLFFCPSVKTSFECGRTGRASLLFNRIILLFLLFFCLKKIGSILFFCSSVRNKKHCYIAVTLRVRKDSRALRT